MSLDVYLHSREKKTVMCHCCWHEHEEQEELFEANITHNLGGMAKAAGIYKACWRPEEIGAKYAKDIIEVLEKGYNNLKSRPEYFEQFDSPNGWGTYKNFLPWVKKYLEACKEYPEAEIKVSR